VVETYLTLNACYVARKRGGGPHGLPLSKTSKERAEASLLALLFSIERGEENSRRPVRRFSSFPSADARKGGAGTFFILSPLPLSYGRKGGREGGGPIFPPERGEKKREGKASRISFSYSICCAAEEKGYDAYLTFFLYLGGGEERGTHRVFASLST